MGIRHPFGAISKETLSNPSGATAVTVDTNSMYLVLDEPAGAVTLNLTIGDEVEAGAMLFIDVKQGEPGRNVTLGTGLTGSDLTGVTSDRDIIQAVYDGSSFLVLSENKVVDAA